MRWFVLFVIPLALWGHTLGEILESVMQNNDLIKAKEQQKNAAQSKLQSQKSTYIPTVDIGGFYQRQDDATPFQPGDIYSGFAKLSYDIYDGGKRGALVDQADANYRYAKLDKKSLQKELALHVTQEFFEAKSLISSLKAREEAQKSLHAQLKRVQSFYDAGMATKDDVDRLQSSYDTNIYDMESIKLRITTLKKTLSLQTGVKIEQLDSGSFSKDIDGSFETLESIKALKEQQKALDYTARSIQSAYYPSLSIEDTYNIYSYERKDATATQMGVDPLDKQNTLMLHVGMRLFDYGAIDKAGQAVIADKLALQSQTAYKEREQKMQLELAKERIQTMRLRIKSAKSALIAAQSAYNTVEKKYNAGIVDYVIFLDALTQKTSAQALYESSLNDLEVSYATYYYYQGKELSKELR